jgi:hypothetical protein
MEEVQKQTPILEIGGKKFDISNAGPKAASLINDLGVVQNELNRVKIQFDIANIAKNTILDNITQTISEGTSGFVEIGQPEAQPAESDQKAN